MAGPDNNKAETAPITCGLPAIISFPSAWTQSPLGDLDTKPALLGSLSLCTKAAQVPTFLSSPSFFLANSFLLDLALKGYPGLFARAMDFARPHGMLPFHGGSRASVRGCDTVKAGSKPEVYLYHHPRQAVRRRLALSIYQKLGLVRQRAIEDVKKVVPFAYAHSSSRGIFSGLSHF